MTEAANTDLTISNKVEQALISRIHQQQTQMSKLGNTTADVAKKAQSLRKISKLENLLGCKPESKQTRLHEIALLQKSGADTRELVRTVLDVPLHRGYLTTKEYDELSHSYDQAWQIAQSISILRVWVLTEKMQQFPAKEVQRQLRAELEKCTDNDPGALKIRAEGWFAAWHGIGGRAFVGAAPLPKNDEDILAAYNLFKACADPQGMAQALIETSNDDYRANSKFFSKMSFEQVLQIASKCGDKVRHLNTRSTIGNGIVNYVAHSNPGESKPVVQAWLRLLATLPARFNLDTDTKEQTEASARLILAGIEASLTEYAASKADYAKAAAIFFKVSRVQSGNLGNVDKVVHDLLEEVDDNLTNPILIDHYRDSTWNSVRNYSAKELASALGEYREREKLFRDEALADYAVARMGESFCSLKSGDLATCEKTYDDTVRGATTAPCSDATKTLYNSPEARVKSIMAPLNYLIAIRYAGEGKIAVAKERIKDSLSSMELVRHPMFTDSKEREWETSPAKLTNRLFPTREEVISGCHEFQRKHG